MSYKVKLVEKKAPLIQLEASKTSIEDLFNDLSDETKDFKHQVTIKILLKKYKSTEIEFHPGFLNSPTKAVINHQFDLDKYFQEILYRIDNWINQTSGWIVESIKSQYINTSTHKPLIGSSYIKLSAALKSPKTGIINIKNNDQKCFLWCHFRHINPVKIHPERITQKDKELVNDLNYEEIKFLAWSENFNKTETKNSICIQCFLL